MKFTDSHEWVELEGNSVACIGITEHAQKELGDIVYVELPIIGKQIKAKEEAAVLESTKAAADIYSPISGKIIEVNTRLIDAPELINQSPENEGWIYKVAVSNGDELAMLMNREKYLEMVNGK